MAGLAAGPTQATSSKPRFSRDFESRPAQETGIFFVLSGTITRPIPSEYLQKEVASIFHGGWYETARRRASNGSHGRRSTGVGCTGEERADPERLPWRLDSGRFHQDR